MQLNLQTDQCMFVWIHVLKNSQKFQSRTPLYLSPASIAWFPVASLWHLPPMIAPHIRQLSSTHGRPHCNTITATHRAYLPLTTVSSADYYYYWPVTTDYLCVPLSRLAVLACTTDVQTTSRNGTLRSLYRSTTLVIKIKGMDTVGKYRIKLKVYSNKYHLTSQFPWKRMIYKQYTASWTIGCWAAMMQVYSSLQKYGLEITIFIRIAVCYLRRR